MRKPRSSASSSVTYAAPGARRGKRGATTAPRWVTGSPSWNGAVSVVMPGSHPARGPVLRSKRARGDSLHAGQTVEVPVGAEDGADSIPLHSCQVDEVARGQAGQ